MAVVEIMEMVESANSTFSTIESLKQSFINILNNIDAELQNVEVLKAISNDQLQDCVDVLKIGNDYFDKNYNLLVVPYPRPLDFKIAMTDHNNPAYSVYSKIINAASLDLKLFSAMWIFTESLWETNYNSVLSGGALNRMLYLISLTPEEKQIFQDILDKYNMQITIN